MNINSRESLLRDGTFDVPPRDSFIRDEFASAPRPPREQASGHKELDEFFSESEWERPRAGGFRLHRAEVVLAIAVIALIVGGVSIWTLVSRGNAPAPVAAAESAAPAQPVVPPAVEPAASLPPPASPATPADRSRPVPRQTATAVPRVLQAGRQAPLTGARDSSRSAVSTNPQANLLTPTLLADTQVETPSTAGLRAEAARTVDARTVDASGMNRVYSSADPDVIPPKMLVEDVPAALIVGMRTRMQAVELMVTESGDVSRVRLLTEQRRILDTMLLSRAKMWRFTPALREGRPVPYRLVVLWETND